MAKSGIDLDGHEFLVCELEAMRAEERDGVLSRYFQQASDEVHERLEEVQRDCAYVRGSLDTLRAILRV
jgi:hypothetical protein